MDQLYKRYADPFSFMNGMIQTGRFSEFVSEFMKTINKEMEDDLDWDFFLHKVWEGTFQEFKEEIETNKKNQNLDKQTIETTVKDSLNILGIFNPINEGGEI